MRFIPLSITLALLSLLPSDSRADSWPLYGHDPEHTFSTLESLPDSMTVSWLVDLPAGAEGRGFVLAERSLCVTGVQSPDPSTSGAVRLYAFEPDTGAQRWSAPLGNGHAASPAIDNGKVYLSTYGPATEGTLHAFSLSDGSLAWSRPIEGGTLPASPEHVPSVTLYEGKVWLPGSGGKILRWDAATGAPLPSLATGLTPPPVGPLYLHTLAAGDPGIFAVAYRRWVYGAPLEDPVWRSDFEGTYTLPPTVSGPNLILAGHGISGGTQPGLASARSSRGTLKWFAPAPEVAALATDSQWVFAAHRDKTVAAYTLNSSGFTEWVREVADVPLALILAGGRIVVGDVKGRLQVRSAFNPDEVRTYATRGGGGPDLRSMHLLAAGGPGAVGHDGTILYSLGGGRLIALGGGRYGDLDGDDRVTVNDVVMLLRAIVRLATLTPAQAARADVSPYPGENDRPLGDGALDVRDALSMLRMVANLQPPGWPFTF